MHVQTKLCTYKVSVFITESLDKLPSGLLRAVETIGDRLVSKAAQLVHNKTTNICENYMVEKFLIVFSLDHSNIDVWLLL